MERLTDKSYWDNSYGKQPKLEPITVRGFVNFMTAQQMKILESAGLDRKNVMEIGGGGSQWLPYLSLKYPLSKFVALDYSKAGCDLILDYAKRKNLDNLDALCGDFFGTFPSLQKFDVVYSRGVVEHFTNLAETLTAFRQFVTPSGILVTSIPNMCGLPGLLTRLLNKKVFDIHVAHDKNSLIKGHRDAGFEILKAGYLGSTDFRVLSSCFEKQEGWKWKLYILLTRISTAMWLFEYSIFKLPTSKYFSPFVYVVARKADKQASITT